MDSEIKDFVLVLLSRKASLPAGIEIDDFRYLDHGQIDSLGLIKFIYELEERFDIELSPEDTQSDGFRTVGGLVSIISRKKSLR